MSILNLINETMYTKGDYKDFNKFKSDFSYLQFIEDMTFDDYKMISEGISPDFMEHEPPNYNIRVSPSHGGQANFTVTSKLADSEWKLFIPRDVAEDKAKEMYPDYDFNEHRAFDSYEEFEEFKKETEKLYKEAAKELIPEYNKDVTFKINVSVKLVRCNDGKGTIDISFSNGGNDGNIRLGIFDDLKLEPANQGKVMQYVAYTVTDTINKLEEHGCDVTKITSYPVSNRNSNRNSNNTNEKKLKKLKEKANESDNGEFNRQDRSDWTPERKEYERFKKVVNLMNNKRAMLYFKTFRSVANILGKTLKNNNPDKPNSKRMEDNSRYSGGTLTLELVGKPSLISYVETDDIEGFKKALEENSKLDENTISYIIQNNKNDFMIYDNNNIMESIQNNATYSNFVGLSKTPEFAVYNFKLRNSKFPPNEYEMRIHHIKNYFENMREYPKEAANIFVEYYIKPLKESGGYIFQYLYNKDVVDTAIEQGIIKPEDFHEIMKYISLGGRDNFLDGHEQFFKSQINSISDNEWKILLSADNHNAIKSLIKMGAKVPSFATQYSNLSVPTKRLIMNAIR